MKEFLSGLGRPVTRIINKVVPDKDEAARLAHEISTMADRHAQELALAQVEDTSRHGSDCDYDGCHERSICRLARHEK